MAAQKGYTKKDVQQVRQNIASGQREYTEELSASVTVEVLKMAGGMSRVTVQSTGDLAGTVEFSVNGQDFFGSTAFTANTPVTYSAHNFNAIRVTRTGGTGRLAIAATA